MSKLKNNTTPSLYVFDIEGTLLDGHNEIRPGTADMFTAIKRKTDKQILFESGMNEKEVLSIIARINEQLEDDCKLTPCIASCCGSRIINEQGTPVFEDIISYEDIQTINRILLKYDPSSAIVYRSATANYVCKIEDLYKRFGKKLSVEEIDKLDNIYEILYTTHNVPLLCKEISGDVLDQMLNNGEIYSLEIAGINLNNDPVLNAKIAKEIQKATGLEYSLSVTMQIARQNKYSALVNFVGMKTASEACYMGDGANDIPCLKKCSHSVAAFAKMQDVVKASKFAVNTNLNEVIPYILGEPYDADHLKKLKTSCQKQALKRRKR
ncbi:MAG: HAD hydrolase family protein [Clostridia bacterium]|nr:HAD hydrolase family protein [Clostridia bacterium]